MFKVVIEYYNNVMCASQVNNKEIRTSWRNFVILTVHFERVSQIDVFQSQI